MGADALRRYRAALALVVLLAACRTVPPPTPPVPLPPLVVPLPPVVPDPPPLPAWVGPDATGAWPEALVDTSAVNHEAVGDVVVIHQGVLIAKIGAWDQLSALWSSCVRTWRTLLTLQAIQGGRAPPSLLWDEVGSPFPTGVRWIHVLSRTSNATPPGTSWRYSGGSHWPWQHQMLERLTGETRETSLARLVAAVDMHNMRWDRDPDDGTTRLDASPYEMAKLGYLMLRAGQWRDTRVFDADLWAQATGGGVMGNGVPDPLEGWQLHLIRAGRYDELGARPPMSAVPDGYFAAGGVNRGYVVVLPAYNLVIARVRRSGVYLDQWLPGLLRALGF